MIEAARVPSMTTNRQFWAAISRNMVGVGLLLVAPSAALAAQESTIFRYDGQDFIREKTTLTTEDGASAVNTKLDRSSPAFEHLVQKKSFTGQAKLFDRTCDSIYAPVVDASGALTGALFVATCNK
jgi:hypothetical protein